MVSRKKIAIVAADVFNEYINKILTGIEKQAKKLDYDIGVFMMTFNKDNDTWLQVGEENIYRLMNPDVIDGAIFICGNIVSKTLIKKLEKQLVDMKIPFVAVDCESQVCESLIAEDASAFEAITDHFIEKHNCRDIMCLTGFEGNPQAESRLRGYRDSLEKHGIPVTEDFIVYGDFWTVSAAKLADEFASGARRKPQAVVCANDLMAATLCDCLVNNGIKVPEEIMISGYDGSGDALNHVPSITTIFPLNQQLGARAVCYLHKRITGEDAELAETDDSYIITAQSCGCGEEAGLWIRKRENYSRNVQHFDTLYRSSGMTERLLEAKSLEDLMNQLDNFAYLINGLDIYMLCLCENWDNIGSETDEDYLKEGYSENMVIKMIRHKSDFYNADITFKSKDIFPDKLYEFADGPSSYFFLPMHFRDRCFGYSIFSFNDIERSLSTLYALWCRNVNIALEFLRVRTKLMGMNQRIFLSSVRDTLTGIYNRKGFKRFSESMFKKAKTEQKKLLILFADLDRLKYINDNFGHMEGDNAITVTANVLNSCCQNNEVCARIGGDEYAIIGCYDYTDEIVEGYVKYINDYFNRYNESSGKQYPVEASLGYFCDVPDDETELQEYLNIADKRMYDNKFERKKCRNN